MATMTSAGWPTSRRSRSTGSEFEVDLNLGEVLPWMEYLFKPTATRQSEQYQALMKLAQQTGVDLHRLPSPEQETIARYAPNIWEQVKSIFGFEYPKYVTPKKTRQVEKELPAPPGLAPGVAQAYAPPTPPKVEEKYWFEERPVGMSKQEIAEYDRTLQDMGYKDPRQRRAILGPWVTKQKDVLSFDEEMSDAQALASRITADPKRQRALVERILTGDSEALKALMPKEVEEATQIVNAARKNYPSLSDLEIAQKVLINRPELFAPWYAFYETLIRTQESAALRKEQAAARGSAAEEKAADAYERSLLMRRDKLRGEAGRAYEKEVSRWEKDVQAWSKTQPEKTWTIQAHPRYQDEATWFSERGGGAKYFKEMEELDRDLQDFYNSQAKRFKGRKGPRKALPPSPEKPPPKGEQKRGLRELTPMMTR